MLMKRIVLNCNDCFAAYKFRLDLIKKLQEEYQIFVVAGFDEYTQLLKREKVNVITVDIDKTGVSLFKELKLFFTYKKILKKLMPDILINYTIKPHLYATLAVKKKTKIINVVTGMSLILTENTILSRLVLMAYRFISHRVNHYVFLNADDYNSFVEMRILKKYHTIIRGEGVNLNNFNPYVDFTKPITFIFIGRLVTSACICIQSGLLVAPPQAYTSPISKPASRQVEKIFSVPKATDSIIAL